MGKVAGVFRAILVWSYERGTFQYDIICGLILAFIFLTPRGCFLRKATAPNLGGTPSVSAMHQPSIPGARRGN